MITEILLVVILIVLLASVVLISLVYRGRSIESKEIEPALSKVWRESGLDKQVGELTAHAKDIRDTHKSIEQMLRVPKERASFGELSLETILSDQLPPDMFGMRERVLDGKAPDAHIKSTVGLICIDSKFPLDNFQKMTDTMDTKEKDACKKQFIRDVQGHLDKICDDYVCPENGSAEFAFAYIPSEGVYYFLVSEAFQMLRNYTSKGVQVVSPLTLAHKVELIKTGVHARKLSEEAQRVHNDILKLSRQFEDVDQAWKVLYQTHLRNAGNQADKLDLAYKKVREEFDRISQLSEDQNFKKHAA